MAIGGAGRSSEQRTAEGEGQLAPLMAFLRAEY